MAIHGIVSTYFGDLEYDLGKSLNWISYFCDSLYVLDVNTADTSRQYIVDWDKQTPNAKYSFATDFQFFGSPSRAASWRKESFRRAKDAWNYRNDDWVLFVDGTECLNVFHAPPESVEVSAVSIDEATGNTTFTTVDTNVLEAGNHVTLTGAFFDYAGSESGYWEHSEAFPTDTWSITHDLHLRPSITALDTTPAYGVLDVEVTHIDRNTMEIKFPEPVSGDVTVSIAAIPAGYVKLDGSYEVLDADGSTFTVAPNFEVASNVMFYDDVLLDTATGLYTTEPTAFHTGDLFQSWLYDEIAAAEAAGKTRISLDGWAMVRSSSPENVEFKALEPQLLVDTNNKIAIPGARVDEFGDVWVSHQKCSEYYLSLSRLVRLVKVSTLSNLSFDWRSLDQSDEDPAGAYAASRLSLISYAYLRWAENPQDMTQSVDPSLPNYSSGTEFYPPLRPISVEVDAGFAMRRLISTVRPVIGAPTEWERQDTPGEQPLVGDYEQLDTLWVEQTRSTAEVQDDAVIISNVFTGYRQYGGTPLYPGVIRANLREGVWYVSNSPAPVLMKVAAFSYNAVNTLITIKTVKEHALSAGNRVSIYGTENRGVDGQYRVFSVPDVFSFTVKRPGLGDSFDAVPTLIAGAVLLTDDFGPIPWNYLLNALGVQDPRAWIQSGAKKTP